MWLESARENIQTGLASIDANGDSFTEVVSTGSKPASLPVAVR